MAILSSTLIIALPCQNETRVEKLRNRQLFQSFVSKAQLLTKVDKTVNSNPGTSVLVAGTPGITQIRRIKVSKAGSTPIYCVSF